MSRKKSITKINQLGFMFDGTAALQTIGDNNFDEWIKENKTKFLGPNKEELISKMKKRFCYIEDNPYKSLDEEITVYNESDEERATREQKEIEDKKARYNKLKILQALPLEFKIQKALQTLEAAADRYGLENLILAYSGGKDSEVLSHLVTTIWNKKMLHIFSNTTCEFPETLQTVFKKAERENLDIIMVSPKMTFKQVVEKYGFPMISKNISKSIRIYRNTKSASTAFTIKDYMERREKKWVKSLDCPFSETCCDKLKKSPMRSFQTAFNYECAVVGTLASESRQRTKEWVDTGCNAFTINQPKCMPLATWTDKDIFEYIEKYNIKLNPLYSMGYSRNGCLYCGYGVHLQKEGENRIKLMKETHPHAYGVFLRNFAKYFDMMKELGYKGFDY